MQVFSSNNIHYNLLSLLEVSVEEPPEVLTQRDAVGELVLQVKGLSECPQKLQDHEGISKEVSGEAGFDGKRARQLLVEGGHR